MNYTDSVHFPSEKKREKILTFGPSARGKTKTFLIGKELKKKTYRKPRRNGQADRQQNPTQNLG